MGNLYIEIGKIDKAIDAYQKTIELNQYSAIPHQNLGQLYMQIKDYKASLTHLQLAQNINHDSKYIDGMLLQAMIYTSNWNDLEKK